MPYAIPNNIFWNRILKERKTSNKGYLVNIILLFLLNWVFLLGDNLTGKQIWQHDRFENTLRDPKDVQVILEGLLLIQLGIAAVESNWQQTTQHTERF